MGTRTPETLDHVLRQCPETDELRKRSHIGFGNNNIIHKYLSGQSHVSQLFVPPNPETAVQHWHDICRFIDPFLKLKTSRGMSRTQLTKNLGEPLVGCTTSYYDAKSKKRYKAEVTKYNPDKETYTLGNSKMLSSLPQSTACWRKLFKYHEDHHLHIFEPVSRTWIDSWALPDMAPFRADAREVRDRPPDPRLQFK